MKTKLFLLTLLLMPSLVFAQALQQQFQQVDPTELTGFADFWTIAISDEVTALTTGTKRTFRAPKAATITNIRFNLNTVSTSGIPTVNIKRNGTTIFVTNKLTVDANELTSVTAAVPYSLSISSFADDDIITIDIDVAGTGAKGAKVVIYVQYD